MCRRLPCLGWVGLGATEMSRVVDSFPKCSCAVAYYRVSTERQGQSGLGLEAQRKAVVDWLNAGRWELVGEFTEVESGKRNKRPELARAIDMCRREMATLIIARLDRLARNVHFVSGLMEAGVDFLAVDAPHASRLAIHILAAVAEDEGRRISERTKAALAAAKRSGVKLGTYGATLAKANKEAAANRAAELAPIIAAIRADGATSGHAIAEALNARGIPAARGGRWHTQTALNLLRLVGGRAKRRRSRRGSGAVRGVWTQEIFTL